MVNGREIWTNASLTVTGGPVTEIHALGIQSIDADGRGGQRAAVRQCRPQHPHRRRRQRPPGRRRAADHLIGQGGSDRYYVDHAGDIANETGGRRHRHGLFVGDVQPRRSARRDRRGREFAADRQGQRERDRQCLEQHAGRQCRRQQAGRRARATTCSTAAPGTTS